MGDKDIKNIIRNVSEAGRCDDGPVRVGASCVAEINGNFFLLVKIEIGNGGADIERLFIIRITRSQANALLNEGVMRCRIRNTIPTATAGVETNLECAFVEGSNVYLIFNVENAMDRLVLVRVPLCDIIGQNS